jgi:hypothetical protein
VFTFAWLPPRWAPWWALDVFTRISSLSPLRLPFNCLLSGGRDGWLNEMQSSGMRLDLIVHRKAPTRGNAQGIEQFTYMTLDPIPPRVDGPPNGRWSPREAH